MTTNRKPSNRASFNVPDSDYRRFCKLPKSFQMGKMVSEVVEKIAAEAEGPEPLKNVCLTLTDEAIQALGEVPFGRRSEVLRSAYRKVLDRWEKKNK